MFFRLPAIFNSQAIDGGVNRTPSHNASTDTDTMSAHHTWCYTLTRGSSWIVCPKQFLIPSLVSRHVSRAAQYTQHFVLFVTFLYFSFVHWLRLKVDHVQNTLRRFTKPWRWRCYGSSTSHKFRFCGSTTLVVLDSSCPGDWTCDTDGPEIRTCGVHENTTQLVSCGRCWPFTWDDDLSLGKRSDPTNQKIKKLTSEQSDIKRLTWTRVPQGIHADVHKYMNKLVSLAVLTTDFSPTENCVYQNVGSSGQWSTSCLSSHCPSARLRGILKMNEVRLMLENWTQGVVSNVKMSNPVVIFRAVCLEEVAVVTTIDASFAKARKRECSKRILTTRSVEKGASASACSMIEFNSAAIHAVVGSTLAPESAALTNAFDREIYVRLLVATSFTGETSRRFPLSISTGRLGNDGDRCQVTLWLSVVDGSKIKERQTIFDLLVIQALLENSVVHMKGVPTTLTPEDIKTTERVMTEVFKSRLESGKYALHQAG